jgi:hypothetical protein
LSSAESVFASIKKSEKTEAASERERLLQTIGELKVENDFLKKVALKSVGERRKLIDPKFDIEQKCSMSNFGFASKWFELRKLWRKCLEFGIDASDGHALSLSSLRRRTSNAQLFDIERRLSSEC